MISSVGIVGYGHFGAFLHELIRRFASAVSVRVYSRRREPDGEKFFSFEDTCQSDAVILCGAIGEYEAQLRSVLAAARPETVIVDVATVKAHTSVLLKTHAADRRFISTHPMFGPESYQKHGGDVGGFRIVVAEHTLKADEYEALRAALSALGFVVIEMSPEAHDRLLAETLFLTHYVSRSLIAGGFSRTEIDTPSFQYLMDAVESVQGDEALFRDVYRFNPFCAEVAARFHTAQEEVFQKLTRVPDELL